MRTQDKEREYALYLLRKSTLFFGKSKLMNFVSQYEISVAFSKAVIFFDHAGLLTQENIESIEKFASLWFGQVELEGYFQEAWSCQITQADFEQLIAVSNDDKEPKLIQFNIACVLCSIEIRELSDFNKKCLIESRRQEEFNEGCSILTRCFQREAFLLENNFDVLQTPGILKRSTFPYHLAISIVKIINTDIFLPCCSQAKTNFTKFIAVFNYWFKNANLKRQFDAIPNSNFRQELFDALLQITEENLADEQKRQYLLSQYLQNWLKEVRVPSELQRKSRINECKSISPGIIPKIITQGIFRANHKMTDTAENRTDKPTWVSSGRPPLAASRQRSITEETPTTFNGIADPSISSIIRRSSV